MDDGDKIAVAPRDIQAALALLGDLDGDLEFFHELFEDPPGAESLGAINTPDTVLSPQSPLLVPQRSDRRRQRWLSVDKKRTTSSASLRCDWRATANTQKHARDAAEKENKKLRKLVAAHERTTQKILKLLNKAKTLASKETIIPTPSRTLTAYAGPPADLAQISQSLDALARDADAVLASSALMSHHPEPLVVENRILSTPTGNAIETTADGVWVLPFDVELITSTLLTHSIRLVTQKDSGNIQTIYDGPQLKILHAVSPLKVMNGLPITKHGQLVTRREPLRPDGSQLLVTSVRGALSMDATLEVLVEGGSYLLVSQVPNHDSTALGPLSCVRWYRRFRAQPSAEAKLTDADRAQWFHAIGAKSTRKAKRQVDKLTQSMENLLLVSPQLR